MNATEVYNEILEATKASLTPEAEDIVKKNCEEIVELAESSDLKYSGIEYKPSAMQAIYIKFEQGDRKFRVDPMYPNSPEFPTKFGTHEYSTYMFLKGDYRTGSENGFSMSQAMAHLYRLDIHREFNKETLNEAETFIKDRRL